MRGGVSRIVIAAAVVMAGGWLQAQDFTVRITVARANVRVGPSLDSEVIGQLTGGTILTLKRIEGNWFRVELPPDPRLSGSRVEAYVSNTVAEIDSRPTSDAPPRPPPAAAEMPAAPPPADSGPSAPAESMVPRAEGISVALQIGMSNAWVTPEPASRRAIAAEIRNLSDLADLLPPPSAAQDPLVGSMTFVWTIAGEDAGQMVQERRPTFAVVYQEIPGVRPEDVVVHLVRIVPVGASGRVVAAVRAPLDRERNRELTWNVMADLVQDDVRVVREAIDRGAVRLQPVGDLTAGEYAIVLRPRAGWRLAGSSVLSSTGEGRLFAWAWGFSIPE